MPKNIIVILLLLILGNSNAQNIDLYRSDDFGSLMFFPVINSPNEFYFLPKNVRLATTKEGLPSFSFLKYVKNTKSENVGRSESAIAGGIVTAVVELKVEDKDLQQATNKLKAKYPNAKIMGALIYEECEFTLVSALGRNTMQEVVKKNEEGKEEVKQVSGFEADKDLAVFVVGTGKGPIMEGGKVAITMRLTPLGASLMWESLQMATPFITFQFTGKLAGYRRPIPAKITADFDRIYASKQMQAALKAGYVDPTIKVNVDIDASKFVDSLITHNFIQIELGDATQKETIDIINSVKEDFIGMMFDKNGYDALALKPDNPDGENETKGNALQNVDENQKQEQTQKTNPESNIVRTDSQKAVENVIDNNLRLVSLFNGLLTTCSVNDPRAENIDNISKILETQNLEKLNCLKKSCKEKALIEIIDEKIKGKSTPNVEKYINILKQEQYNSLIEDYFQQETPLERKRVEEDFSKIISEFYSNEQIQCYNTKAQEASKEVEVFKKFIKEWNEKPTNKPITCPYNEKK